MTHPVITHLRELEQKATPVGWKPGRQDMLSSDSSSDNLWKAIYHKTLKDGEHLGQPMSLDVGRMYGRTNEEIFANSRLVSESRNALPTLLDCIQLGLDRLKQINMLSRNETTQFYINQIKEKLDTLMPKEEAE